jgi:hypothetical protein
MDSTEALVKLWGMYRSKDEYANLGYSRQPLSRLYQTPSCDLPEEAEIEMEKISKRVLALNEVEPDLAKVVIARYCYGEELEKIGEHIPNPKTGKARDRNAVGKMAIMAISYIAGSLD